MRFLITSLLSCVLGLFCFAHEYLLLARQYRLKKGDMLELHLFVADGFNIQLERPFQKAPTVSFELMTSNGIVDLANTEEGSLPIVNRAVDFEGGGLVHLERGYARINLATPKFLDYLKEDHIEGIAQKVDRNKEEQKERYTRYIKCLVQSGDDHADTLYKTVTGQAFEIVPLENPYFVKMGQLLKVRLLFKGKPLANKVMTARNRKGNAASRSQTSTTDTKGVCTFRLDAEGDWFIHGTHMIRCADPADADWESFWTSFSFGR